MSRKKSSEIPHYEMLFIIANKFSEDEVKPIVEKTRKIIADNGGTITYSEEWGKKKLAYPIKHNHHGYYFLFEFDIVAEKIDYLNTTFRMSSELLRHQIVNKRIKSEQEVAKDKKIAEKIAAKLADVEKKEQIKEAKAASPAPKVDLKELDAKLDKILETDDLF